MIFNNILCVGGSLRIRSIGIVNLACIFCMYLIIKLCVGASLRIRSIGIFC